PHRSPWRPRPTPVARAQPALEGPPPVTLAAASALQLRGHSPRSTPPRVTRGSSAPGIRSKRLLGLCKRPERLFQPLLLGPVGRPVPSPEGVLGSAPALPRPLGDLARPCRP